MTVENLSLLTTDSVLELCSILKSNDEHPCSFWNYSKENIQNLIESDNYTALVSKLNEKVTGIGVLSLGGKFQNHWAEISIAIHPEFRKIGIGKKLIFKLEEYRTELKIEFIKALILENNKTSRNFFLNFGYEHKTTLYNDFKSEKYGNLNDCVYYKIFSR